MNKISILMATYNGEKYVAQQIDSIINQTVQDFELYISDDGSSDSTLDIIKEYLIKDERIKLLDKHLPSGSACKNFLYLLENVESDLYLFSDQDDVWTPDHIELLLEEYNKLSNEQKNTPVVVHGNFYIADKDLNVISNSGFAYMNLPENPDNKHYYFVDNNVTGGVTLINNEVKKYIFHDKELLFNNVEKIHMHDIFVASVAAEFGTVLTLNKPIEYYRQHDNNVFGAKDYNDKRVFFKKLFSFSSIKKSFCAYKKAINEYQCYSDFFVKYFINIISEEEKKVLLAFSLLSKRNKLYRIKFLRKNHFLKYGRRQNIWLFLVI